MAETPTHPSLTALCLESDKLIKQLNDAKLKYAYISRGLGVVSIILSISITQKDSLSSLITFEAFWIIIAYVLAVVIAIDKFFGFEAKRQAFSQALYLIYSARHSIYFKEKQEQIKAGGNPVSVKFATILAAELALAMDTALKVLQEKGLL